MQLDFDPSVDYYKALGVDAKATPAEIKRVYRKLAKEFHPDSTGGDKAKESRFKEISAAYDVLGDAQRRARYDQVRALGGGARVRAGQPTAGGFSGFGEFGSRGPGAAGGQGQVWDLGDLFAQMFQDGSTQRGSAGRRSVRFERPDEGYESWRAGQPGAAPAEPASGTRIEAADGSWLTVKGADVYSDARIGFERAILGAVVEVATVDGTSSVKIPPGSSSGRKLRLRGKGVVGPTGQIGDHFVTVHLDVPSDLDETGQRLLHDLSEHLAAASRGAKRTK